MIPELKESPSFRALEDAFERKKREWYGELWNSVDWYGIANRDIPEDQRQDIMRWLRSENGGRQNHKFG